MNKSLFAVFCVVFLCACGPLALPPKNLDFQTRLSNFPTSNLPLEQSVKIHWQENAIPYIEAQTDKDAAFVLGLTHAHLRLGQMEILKRIAHGRISEMAGPMTISLDEALRHLGFWRASQTVYNQMPARSKNWLDHYVAGINFYKENVTELPHEFNVLGIDNSEKWHPHDTLTIGRLSGTDVNWLSWFGLLSNTDSPDYEAIYKDFQKIGAQGAISIADEGESLISSTKEHPQLETLKMILAGFSKSGSNSIAISGKRTKSGKPLIANDPHLGFFIPNAWVTMGLKSPSYHAVGMMVPGIPVFGFGRTPHFAWGGTNMRALNSDLVDVTTLKQNAFAQEQHLIKVRYWPDHVFKARTTKYGPVISDASLFPAPEGVALSLKWVGHQVSDEITALLDASRAQNYDDFKGALSDFAIPAQNFVYADTSGDIAITLATKIAKRGPGHKDSIIQSPDQVEADWRTILTAQSLPDQRNPERGFIASANNRPAETSYPIGYFFSPDERIRRLIELGQSSDQHDLDSMMALQMDTKSLLALEIRDALSVKFDLPSWLSSWDGYYHTHSHEALKFEVFLNSFAPGVFEEVAQSELYENISRRITMRGFLLSYIVHLPSKNLEQAFKEGIRAADKVPATQIWGDNHTLAVSHLLGRIPVLGNLYRQDPIAVAGSQETILKTAHPTTDKKHQAFYGAQSRHISDLSDPDENYFILFGGNDGWIGSNHAYDQIRMWQKGAYIRLPLTLENFDKKYTTELKLSF